MRCSAISSLGGDQFCTTSLPVRPARGGTADLTGHWGGEAVYFHLPDGALKTRLTASAVRASSSSPCRSDIYAGFVKRDEPRWPPMRTAGGLHCRRQRLNASHGDGSEREEKDDPQGLGNGVRGVALIRFGKKAGRAQPLDCAHRIMCYRT